MLAQSSQTLVLPGVCRQSKGHHLATALMRCVPGFSIASILKGTGSLDKPRSGNLFLVSHVNHLLA